MSNNIVFLHIYAQCVEFFYIKIKYNVHIYNNWYIKLLNILNKSLKYIYILSKFIKLCCLCC